MQKRNSADGVRLLLLRELCDSLDAALAAIPASTWAALEKQASRQAALCLLWQSSGVAEACPVGCEPDSAARELFQLGARIREQNRVYAALLRRTRRTLDMIERGLWGANTTYRNPKARQTTGMILP